MATDMPDLIRMMGCLEGMVYRCRDDADWTMTYVSEGCKALTGYETSALLSREITFEQLIHEDQRRIPRDHRTPFEGLLEPADQRCGIGHRLKLAGMVRQVEGREEPHLRLRELRHLG